MQLLEPPFHRAVPVDDRVDRAVRAFHGVERVPERAPLEQVASARQVGHRAVEVDPHVRGGGELLAGRGDHADDPLELGLLDRLEARLRQLRPLPVVAFLDCGLGLVERLLANGRVCAEGPGILHELREVPRTAVERSLERLLGLRAALSDRVVRFLEIEVPDVAARPLDQRRGLRRVGPELRRGPDEILDLVDLLVHGRGQVIRDRLEGFVREIEGALEIVVLHRGPRSGEEVLDRSDVAAQVLGRQDERLGLRERGGQVLLEHLLAPLPRLLREVDRGAEVLGGERAFGFRECRLGLRELPADAFRESAERRTRVDDRARPLPVDPLAPFERFARLVDGDLVVLRSHRLVRLGEGLLRLDDVRVRPAGLVDEVLRRLDAVFGGLARPRRLFDLFLQLAAQLAVSQVPAHGSSAPLPRGTASALPEDCEVTTKSSL